ncbi:PTS sugar transporter subunit IIA [Anaerorhabdus sp.]|uniref:PTS sugar transporter subunit IIA n=1 Tax=Anaerorhabdus sp. TaxID=1872524 RepID=UPI002FC824A6
MRKTILASHGHLAEGMKDAAKLITGSMADSIETYCLLPGNSPTDYAEKLETEIKNSPEIEYVIVTDLYGASVCTAMVPLTKYPNVRLFTGLNLAMVLNLLLSFCEPLTTLNIADIVQETKEGIKFIEFSNQIDQVENDF